MTGNDRENEIFTRFTKLDAIWWDGSECEGYPAMTLLRGRVIGRDGRLYGSPADGRWLSRKVAPRVAAQTFV